MSESDANRALSDTARLRTLVVDWEHPIFPSHMNCDPLEDTQRMDVHDRRRRAKLGALIHEEAVKPRERRKPATVGARQAASHARDVFADRQQELIEAGIWPRYEP